jgi:hypothetical protein
MVSMPKRIGFIDFQLENYHANVFLNALRGPLQARGWTVAGAWGSDAANGKTWAEKNEVAWFDSPVSMNDHVDAYMILAPSNPELHLDLCRRVFPFGKTTYVDKTFAPELGSAREIFALGDRYGCAIQTSSALRYTNVQKHLQSLGQASLKQMTCWGGGSSFDEYAIHPVEMLISCMGPDAVSLLRRGEGKFSQLLVNFGGDRTGTINVYTQSQTPFAASLTTDSQTCFIPVETERIFINQASAVLDLFESGKPGIDRNETLTIRRILDAAADPSARERFLSL